MKKDKLILAAGGAVLISFIIGIFFGLSLLSHTPFEFEFKLGFGEVLNMGTTIFLAWIVSVIWRNQQFRQDGATELVVSRLEHAWQLTQALRIESGAFFAGKWDNEVWKKSVLAPLTEIANLIAEAEGMSSEFHEDGNLTNCKTAYYSLKRNLTSFTPTDLPNGDDLTSLETYFSGFRGCLMKAIANAYHQ